MKGKEFKILGAITFLFLAGVLGVWIHKLLIDVRPIHKILPLTLIFATMIGVRFTLLRNISLIRIIRDYFKEKTHPLNLAIFRIVLFAFIYQFMSLDRVLFFGRLPSELILPPTGMNWIIHYLPINVDAITNTEVIFRFFCLTAAAGLFTRFSAFMVAILGIYYLGVPQFFGKVNHYNHLIWFSLLLSASRAGDYLSIDALIRAFRKPSYIPKESTLYALPLKFIWILFGMIYFFPGLWKLYDSGYAWIFADNLQLKLYTNWFWKTNWSPLFRLTDYPVLCRLLGAGTLFFELSFIALIFLPKLRAYVGLGGLLFHKLTNAFMGISFHFLQICYVVFFDWYKIAHRLTGFFFKQNTTILYDGNCKMCQRTIAVLRVIDLIHHVRYVNVLKPQASAILKQHRIDQVQALKTMHVIRGKKVYTGFFAYRALIFRYPLLWPILPLLFIWPIPFIGRKVYQHIAGRRQCATKSQYSSGETAKKSISFAGSYFTVAGMGLILIMGNIYLGVQKNSHAWPFSCYPTFSNESRGTTSTLMITAVDQKGEKIEITTKRLAKGFSFERFKGLINRTLRVSDLKDRNQRLEALWAMITQNNDELADITSVQFYSIIYSVLPEEIKNNPLDKKLIYEWIVRTK